MTKNYQPTIVALLDKPSAESFGMVGLIVTVNSFNEMYQTAGLSSKNMVVTPYQLNQQLSGHILNVQSPLPVDLVNPVAVWIGSQFYSKATELKAPSLPTIDQSWHQPLEPEQTRGNYAIKESKEAYKILENWVTEAATDALLTNNYDLAVLTSWTLPLHPAAQAALYFTAANKPAELKMQLRIERDKKKTPIQLVQGHEEVRSSLLRDRREFRNIMSEVDILFKKGH